MPKSDGLLKIDGRPRERAKHVKDVSPVLVMNAAFMWIKQT